VSASGEYFSEICSESLQKTVKGGSILGHSSEYKWPLLDRRLVQQWLPTPTVWKTGVTRIGRYQHRAAVDGVCAPEVPWKPGKEMGMIANMALHAPPENSALFKGYNYDDRP
jgi:hypothetical protein